MSVQSRTVPDDEPVTTTRDLDWMRDALCAQTDPEIFFPPKGGGNKRAKKICAQCPVREECQEYSLAIDERYGIWGGLSRRERTRVQAGQAVQPPTPAGPSRHDRHALITELAAQGKSIPVIAEKAGISTRTVRRTLDADRSKHTAH